MCIKICIASQKGGSGKTTTALNLAASLALSEKRTLLIDADPQGNATTGLGIDKKKMLYGLYHAITGKADIDQIIQETRLDYLKIIPTQFDLVYAEKSLIFKLDRENMLDKLLQTVEIEYDYIIIDSAPSLGFMTSVAVIAADWLLVPIQYQFYSMEGLANLIGYVQSLRQEIKPNLKIAGLVVTMCDHQDEIDKQTMNHILSHFGTIFTTSIPFDRQIRDAADQGRPIVLLDAMSEGSHAYLNLCAELFDFYEKNTQSLSPY